MFASRMWAAWAATGILATPFFGLGSEIEYEPAPLRASVSPLKKSPRAIQTAAKAQTTIADDHPAASQQPGLSQRLETKVGEEPAPVADPAMQMPDDSVGVSCSDGSCDMSCGSPCDDDCCDPCARCCDRNVWQHRSSIWFEYLYLHPTDADMAHAFQQNGVGGPGTVPYGNVGTVDPDYSSSYRLGFDWARSDCSSIVASWTKFESHASDTLTAPNIVGGNVGSLVLHPATTNAGSTSSLVNASYDIDFQLVDIDYNAILTNGCDYVVNYTVGARYGKLEQSFRQLGSFAPPLGEIQTDTDINFDGGGVKVGLDGRRQIGSGGFSVYGKSFFSALFGEFRNKYSQVDNLTTVTQALSNWHDDRVVPILEYELGVSWTSCSGRWRFSGGYYNAFWFNVITTADLVQSVQGANFNHPSGEISFNGLTSRLEYRF